MSSTAEEAIRLPQPAEPVGPPDPAAAAPANGSLAAEEAAPPVDPNAEPRATDPSTDAPGASVWSAVATAPVDFDELAAEKEASKVLALWEIAPAIAQPAAGSAQMLGEHADLWAAAPATEKMEAPAAPVAAVAAIGPSASTGEFAAADDEVRLPEAKGIRNALFAAVTIAVVVIVGGGIAIFSGSGAPPAHSVTTEPSAAPLIATAPVPGVGPRAPVAAPIRPAPGAGTTVPSAALSGTIPPSALPGATLPSAAVPSTAAPGMTAPTAPSTTAPTTTAPTTVAPSTTTPSTTAPSTTAPGTVAAGTTAPSTIAPGTVAPSSTAPSSTAPSSTAGATLAVAPIPAGQSAPTQGAGGVPSATAPGLARAPITHPAPAPAPQRRLQVRATPSSATLTLDGASISNPYDGRLAQGTTHTIVATAPGFAPRTETITLSRDHETTLRLERAPSPATAAAPPSRSDSAAARRGGDRARPSSRRHGGARESSRHGAGFVTESPY